MMTSMFFAMLVLFIVVVVAMGAVNRKVKEVNDKLKNTVISPFTDRMLYAGAF